MTNMSLLEFAPQDKRTHLYFPPARYTLSNAEMTSFYKSLYELKVSIGYCSNFKQIVSIIDLKLTGIKSHYNHILMQQFLSVVIH